MKRSLDISLYDEEPENLDRDKWSIYGILYDYITSPIPMIELKLVPGIRPRRYYPEKEGKNRTPVEVNENEEIWDVLDIIDELYDEFDFEPSDDDYGMKCSDGHKEYYLLEPPSHLIPKVFQTIRESSKLKKIGEEERGFLYVRFKETNYDIPVTLRMNKKHDKEEIILGKPLKLELVVR